MSNFRSIHPRADDPTALASGAGHGALRRFARVTRSCEMCRQKKRKCDRVRPRCRNCIAWKADCQYEGDAAQSKIDEMATRLRAFEDLFETLKVCPSDQADTLLERIRCGSDVTALLQPGGPNLAPISSSATPGQGDDSEGLSSPSPASNWNKSSAEPSASTTPPSLEGSTCGSSLYGLHVADLPLTQEAIDTFYTSSGPLFHVFSREQMAAFVDQVYDKTDCSQDEKLIALCCMSAMCAIGIQYGPGKFNQAVEDAFYRNARSLLDQTIEKAALDSIKVCILLAMYNAMNKGTVALAYIETGLSTSRLHGLFQKKCPNNNFTPAQWIDYRKAWRTLVFLSSWLSSTLGYIAPNDTLSQIPLSEMNIDDSHKIEDIVQTEMTKISLLKVTILRLHFTFKDLAAPTVEMIMKDLENWNTQLPAQMHLTSLSQEDIPTGIRRSIYYTHLLYLGAVMLVYRRIAHQCRRALTFDRDSDRAISENTNLNRLAYQGVMAARHSARILGLLVADNGVFGRCWLTIFQAYTSCVAILHSAVQAQLHGLTSSEDLALAPRCLEVLEHCGRLDHVASKFCERMTALYKEVCRFEPPESSKMVTIQQPAHKPSFGAVSSLPSESWTYLLRLPQNSDPDHATLSIQLLEMLCVPFGDEDFRSNVDALVKIKGWRPQVTCYEHPQLIEQLDWDLEKEMLSQKHSQDTPLARLSLLTSTLRPPTGAFISGSVPHGWTVGGFPTRR